MKTCRFPAGTRVVVNNLSDTQIYLVKEVINQFTVKLHYKAGNRWVNAGVMDTCYLRRPNKKQLSLYATTLEAVSKPISAPEKEI